MKNFKNFITTLIVTLTSLSAFANRASFAPLELSDYNQMESGASCWLENGGQVYAIATGEENLYIKLDKNLNKLVSTSTNNVFAASQGQSYYNIPESEFEVSITQQPDSTYTMQAPGLLTEKLTLKCGD